MENDNSVTIVWNKGLIYYPKDKKKLYKYLNLHIHYYPKEKKINLLQISKFTQTFS